MKTDKEFPDYAAAMPTAQTAQQTLRLLDKNWKSFFASVKDWSKNKDKYPGKPKLPKYASKNGRKSLIVTNQNCKLKDGRMHFPKSFHGFECKFYSCDRNDFVKLSQVRFLPHYTVALQSNRLIQMIEYKAQEIGVTVVLTEESYTSGTSFIDNEMPVIKNTSFVIKSLHFMTISMIFNT